MGYQLGGNVHAGSLILGNTGIDLTDTIADDSIGILQVAAEVDVAVGCLHLDVADLGLVGGVAVEHTQTAIEREVGNNLAGSTDLHTIIILAALHVAVHVVALGTQRSKHGSNVAHHTLEGTQTVVKLAGTAAARY